MAKGLLVAILEGCCFYELAAKNGLLVFLELLDMKGLDVISADTGAGIGCIGAPVAAMPTRVFY